MTEVAVRTHAAGVIAALEAAGVTVGDAEAGIRVGSKFTPFTAYPYAVVYDIAGGVVDGPLSDPDTDVEWPFQVTCVAQDPMQARWLADKVRAALSAVSVSGRRVLRVIPDGMPSLQRDDDTALQPLFYLTPRWRLFSTPV